MSSPSPPCVRFVSVTTIREVSNPAPITSPWSDPLNHALGEEPWNAISAVVSWMVVTCGPAMAALHHAAMMAAAVGRRMNARSSMEGRRTGAFCSAQNPFCLGTRNDNSELRRQEGFLVSGIVFRQEFPQGGNEHIGPVVMDPVPRPLHAQHPRVLEVARSPIRRRVRR